MSRQRIFRSRQRIGHARVTEQARRARQALGAHNRVESAAGKILSRQRILFHDSLGQGWL